MGMKTAFYTKHIISKYFWNFIMYVWNSKSDWRKCIFEEIQHSTTKNSKIWVLVLLQCYYAFSYNVMLKFKIIIIKKRTFTLYIFEKMLSPSLDALLKLSKIISPKNYSIMHDPVPWIDKKLFCLKRSLTTILTVQTVLSCFNRYLI